MPVFGSELSARLTGRRLCLLVLLPGLALADELPSFLDADAITWKVNAHEVARWKTLVGGSEGEIDDADIRFGLWQLAPGAIYHGHRHEVPEIYHVTGGRGTWTVGDETREVTAGSTIYTRPGEVHRMVNLEDHPLTAIWVWWAPGGDRDVFDGNYEFTEPAPPLLNGKGFDEGLTEQIYGEGSSSAAPD